MKIPFGGYEEILHHKLFIMLQRQHGKNASVNRGFQELSTFNVYLHMNDTEIPIQSSQCGFSLLVYGNSPYAERISISS